MEGKSRGAPKGSSRLPAEKPGVPLSNPAPAKRFKSPLGLPCCTRKARCLQSRFQDILLCPALSAAGSQALGLVT